MTADTALDSTTAVALSSSAILSSLIVHLKAKGVLSEDDEREIHELALMFIEQSQAESEGEIDHVYEMARAVIEDQLRPKS